MPTDRLVELKPCPVPWCPSKPRLIYGQGIRNYVVCNGCGVCASESNDKTLAIAAWNTRPVDPTIAELVAALEELASEARSACDARQFPPLIEALQNADYLLTKVRSAL